MNEQMGIDLELEKLKNFAKEISEDPEPRKCFEEICEYEEYNVVDRSILAGWVKTLLKEKELKI